MVTSLVLLGPSFLREERKEEKRKEEGKAEEKGKEKAISSYGSSKIFLTRLNIFTLLSDFCDLLFPSIYMQPLPSIPCLAILARLSELI